MKTPSTRSRPAVIAIAGIDGSGKSTQCAALRDYFEAQGLRVLTPEQPNLEPMRHALDVASQRLGATGYLHALGADSARLAISTPKWVALAAILDEPACDYDIVVLDRSPACTVALAVADGVANPELLAEFFSLLPPVDLTIRLAVAPQTARDRITTRGVDDETIEFLDRYDSAYEGLKASMPFVDVDGERSEDDVALAILEVIQKRFPELAVRPPTAGQQEPEPMLRRVLNRQQIERYRTDGYLVMPRFFSPGEVNDWRAAIEAALQKRSDEYEASHNDSASAEYQASFDLRVNLWQTTERMRTLVLDGRIGSVVSQLMGRDRVRLWHDQALVKEPYADAVTYHLDAPYWSFESADALTMWIALDNITATNGALVYLPGSHTATSFQTRPINTRGIGAVFELYPELAGVEPVPCLIQPGDVIFHNGLTVHGSLANFTGQPRRAMTLAFMPDGARFNGHTGLGGYRNALPPEVAQRLRTGDLLDDDAVTPLVFG